MTSTHTIDSLLTAVDQALSVTPTGKLRVKDESKLRAKIDVLAGKAALSKGAEAGAARWLIWEAALALGIFPASINGLYAARGRGETPTNFTVPAMNLRALTFDCARAAFRAAAKLDAGALIFEIARSEMVYTEQRPPEYTTTILAAAIKENHRGPIFIQGDHFQVNGKKYLKDPEAEVNAVKELAVEAIAAGFFNIDVDTSTLVDLNRSTIPEQQEENTRRCAELTAYLRSLEPKGVTLSVGGEIGEVGGKNSTEIELRAFMDGYKADLLNQSVNGRRIRGGPPGISKISIQTGTSHGGVVLSDGRMADVAVDFDVLKRLSFLARREYGLAGAVQHGASTLPESAFSKFTECEACEVHLATGFQNKLYEQLPAMLREEIYDWLKTNAADERKSGDSDDQFFYKTRKKALGPFKPKLWGLPDSAREEIRAAWEGQFNLLFDKLNIIGTRGLVEKHVEATLIHKQPEDFGVVEKAAEDVSDLAD